MILKDKIAIVTGSGEGIGRGIALELIKEGAKVTIADINEGGIQETISQANRLGGEATAVQADISSENDINMMIGKTMEKFGRIDILVNNAGIVLKRVDLVDTTDEHWNKILSVNLTGLFKCCRAVLPHMIKNKYGKIVNISSVLGKKGSKGLTICDIDIFATPQPTNSTVPTGGVQRPTLKFKIIIIPKWTGSIPSSTATGRKIGVKIRTAGVISINTPTPSNVILMMTRMRKGLSLSVSNPEVTICGIFSYDMTHDIPRDVPINKATIAVVLQLARMVLGKSASLSSLLITQARIKAYNTAIADASVAVNIPAMIPPITMTIINRLGIARANFWMTTLSGNRSDTGYFLRNA